MSKLTKEGKISNLEFYLIQTNKKVIPVEENIVNLYNKEGERTGTAGIIRDISERKRFEEALNTLQESWKTADAIFCHQEFYGVQMGAIKSLDGDKWLLDYPYVFSGHIHDRQQLQPNLYYVGSCLQHAFGESSKKTVALLNFEKESINILEIPTNLPRKKIVYVYI